MIRLFLLWCSCCVSTWAYRHDHGHEHRTRILAQEDTPNFVLLPGEVPNVTALIEAVSNNSDSLNRTIASSRTTTPSGSKVNSGTRSKSITTLTSAIFIAVLGLFTGAVLYLGRRYQEQRRARGEHVLDGIQQRQDLIQYNEALRQQRIHTLMNQMGTSSEAMAGPATFRSMQLGSQADNSRTFAAVSNRSDEEQEGPGRFRISVPGNMHLNVSDAPAGDLMECHTASRGLFSRQARVPQDPSTVYSQHLRSRSPSRTSSPDPWNTSGSLEHQVQQHCSRLSQDDHTPQETAGRDWGHLWGPTEAVSAPMPGSVELSRSRTRRNAISAPLQFRNLSRREVEDGMAYGFASGISIGSTSGSDP